MSDNESDVFSTIMAFEQILEVMPFDRGALETVVRAYDELGDAIRAKDYTMRLVKVLIEGGDVEGAAGYVDKLRLYAADDAQVAELVQEVEILQEDALTSEAETKESNSEEVAPAESSRDAGGKPLEQAESAESSAGSVRMYLHVADEMSFAWNLLQAELLTQEQYAGVVHDLAELAVETQSGTVSVLHILQAGDFRNFDKMLVAAARDTSVPLVHVQQFDIQRETAEKLPLQFIVNRGALPFDRIGNELLVAILNPYDESLRRDVEALTGCACHWFLALPDGFDKAVYIVKEMLAADSEAKETK